VKAIKNNMEKWRRKRSTDNNSCDLSSKGGRAQKVRAERYIQWSLKPGNSMPWEGCP
jgi:hypothetical protein